MDALEEELNAVARTTDKAYKKRGFRIGKAQHKRPGRQAIQRRRQDALDRLTEKGIPVPEKHEMAFQSLRRKLGIA